MENNIVLSFGSGLYLQDSQQGGRFHCVGGTHLAFTLVTRGAVGSTLLAELPQRSALASCC